MAPSPATRRAAPELARWRFSPRLTIAKGGTSEIVLADAVTPDGERRRVVLKRLLPHLAHEPDFAAMLEGEGWLGARMDHRNVVELLGHLPERSGAGTLVLEHVEGCDLATAMAARRRAGGRFSVAFAAIVGAAVCRALDHLHHVVDDDELAVGALHRDVNPKNVLLRSDGRVKLADFGIAKGYWPGREATRAGVVKGKFGYLAPEQLSAEPLDARTDLFAVGILLWELLAGQELFGGADDLARIQAARDCRVPDLRTVRPETPPAIVALLARALARRRDDRPASAALLAEALERVVASLGIRDPESYVARELSGLLASDASACLGEAGPFGLTAIVDSLHRAAAMAELPDVRMVVLPPVPWATRTRATLAARAAATLLWARALPPRLARRAQALRVAAGPLARRAADLALDGYFELGERVLALCERGLRRLMSARRRLASGRRRLLTSP